MQAHLLTSIALSTNTLRVRYVFLDGCRWVVLVKSVQYCLCSLLATLGPLNKNLNHPSAPSGVFEIRLYIKVIYVLSIKIYKANIIYVSGFNDKE